MLPMKFVKPLALMRHFLRAIVYGGIGAILMLIVGGVISLNNRPDLKIWHEVELDEEFRAGSETKTFEQYLELEDRLFKQLDEEIYQQIEPEDENLINRYFSGSLSDPGQWAVNWNRSFHWQNDNPEIGVLLLHGMSDSPYSMRIIGEDLHSHGASVIGLRIPGHGQAPSGLLGVEWEDMAESVELAMRHLRATTVDRPLYIVGYSNGGALAVHYALESLHEEDHPAINGLVLLSPEIGISKLAALAIWQERLGRVLGLEKLAWNDLLPEYEPWKYGSFALNAGVQAYRITTEIQTEIATNATNGDLARMPPILAFQSVVDATVSAPALVKHLFGRLPMVDAHSEDAPRQQNELVLFDINRWAEIEPLMTHNLTAWIDPLRDNQQLKFQLTFVSNNASKDQQLDAIVRKPGATSDTVCDTNMVWPAGIYSLSHVALPFAPDDPVYGVNAVDNNEIIQLGDLALRGERKVLRVPAASMLRLRWNPFHAYMMQRMRVFLGIENPPDLLCDAHWVLTDG